MQEIAGSSKFLKVAWLTALTSLKGKWPGARKDLKRLDRTNQMNKNGAVRRLVAFGAMQSDIGAVRSVNEDTVVFVVPDPEHPEQDIGVLALVADGMGGHAAGEVASALAAEAVRRIVYSARSTDQDSLRIAFDTANRDILDYSEAHPETNGMGTTCTAILIDDDQLSLAHIGDSRAYLLRDGVLEQLSDDHTLHAQLVRDKVMTAAEAAKSPGGNIISQALGTRAEIVPTLFHGRLLYPGDMLLLCSDGLYTLVTDTEIAQIMQAHGPQDACRALIDKANVAGGFDNISVGVFRMSDAALERRGDPAATKQIRIPTVVEEPGGPPQAQASLQE